MTPAGGIIFPIVLQALSMLAARCAGTPDFIIAGMVKTPVVATFPAPLPDKAPIKVLPMAAVYAAPPLSLPKTDRMTFTTESMACVASSILASTKKAMIA
jgi:hypothetical protein